MVEATQDFQGKHPNLLILELLTHPLLVYWSFMLSSSVAKEQKC